jgi:prevent-host-death family protein
MKQVNIAEAKAQLSDLVHRALAGEEVIIARDSKPLVKLVPPRGRRHRASKARVRQGPGRHRPRFRCAPRGLRRVSVSSSVCSSMPNQRPVGGVCILAV